MDEARTSVLSLQADVEAAHLGRADAVKPRRAEVVPFTVPSESDKTLLVWELSPDPKVKALHRSLSSAFSRFGLLYAVRVFANAAAAPPGFYAARSFYSARAAHSAQGACGRQLLFQSSPLKVCLSRHKAVQHRALALNSSQCQELASYYFGFNGWSERIVRLQDLSDLEERENEDIVAPLQKQSMKIFCALEVVLSPFDCKSPGVGIAKEILDKLEGLLPYLLIIITTQKFAIQKAVSDAFQKLLIVVLESGKIPVEYRPFEELTDARTT
ncbi:RAD52 motif-containing protein 1-like [Sorex araneus]|uniref:RAD52 motif-containing protein 1-like n=1 Tax=Sorex araneus TaxID=42254 RepID=UPI0024338960|nr:RAD52 motif-containing protein 1-like [Sorex araneus]